MTLKQYRKVRKLYLKWARVMNRRWNGNDSTMDEYERTMRSPKLEMKQLLSRYAQDKAKRVADGDWEYYDEEDYEFDTNIFKQILEVLS